MKYHIINAIGRFYTIILGGITILAIGDYKLSIAVISGILFFISCLIDTSTEDNNYKEVNKNGRKRNKQTTKGILEHNGK